MTLKQVYEYGQKQLKKFGIEDADLDAWYLLEYVTGLSRAQYFMNEDAEMDTGQEEQYNQYIEIRSKHIPLQHITGVQAFMGLEFSVNEHVLIPRQDTEILVETVLEDLKQGEQILDMCTGSGCILISLLKLKDGVQGIGADISKEALEVAGQNADKHGVELVFVQSDLFTNVEGEFDVIVSNPPYIRTSVIEELQEEVRLYDPFIALDGKEDGLYFYRKIIEESPKYLRNHGRLYFEIGHDQGEEVKRLMEQKGFHNVTVKKDLAGLDRAVFGVYNI